MRGSGGYGDVVKARRRVARRGVTAMVVAIVAGIVLTACTGYLWSPRPAPSASETIPGAPAALPAGTTTVSLSAGGQDRTYRVHVPEGLSPAAPLVLMLHGGYGSGAQAERSYGWDTLSDSEHVVVAYPDAMDRAWNSGGGCCGAAARQDIDDVAFLTAVVADVEARISIDPARVYAAGMSNGAMMAYRLACETTVFAAIGAVAGTIAPDTDCASPAPISVMAVHGTADTRVLYDGGTSTVGSAQIDARPAPAIAALWRDVDGCPEPSTTTATPEATIVAAACPAGRAVELVTIDGYGHEWPSTAGSQTPYGEDVYTGWDATTQLWAFFTAHPKP